MPKPSTVGGQNFLEGDHGRRVTVRRGKSVVHIAVKEGGQPSHEVRRCHLFRGEVNAVLEGGDLLREIPEVVEQQDFAVFQRPDALCGGGTCDVLDEMYRFAQDLGETGRMPVKACQ